MRLAALVLACAPLFGADWKPASGLTTPWTADVRAESALPDYPRPQMAREAWTNLNGLWDYAIAPKDAPRPQAFEGSILVPFPIESALSGVKRAVTPDQRLWYRRSFQAGDLKGKRLLLHFGAVDWRTEVFVNGTKVGEHEGGYDPFTFDITSAVKPGAQELTVAVWDPTDTGLQPRGKQVLNPNGIFYTAVTGIWQTVWLEPVREAYVQSISITPDLDARALRLSVESSRPGNFTAVATLHGKTVGRVTGKTGAAAAIPLNAIEPWSPDSPTLYDLDIKLASGDSVRGYFGMRKIELKRDAAGVERLFLNRAPQFMIGPLDQGWWPDGLYTAPTDAAIRFDIDTLKSLGYNMLRKHVKVEPARYYYWCDNWANGLAENADSNGPTPPPPPPPPHYPGPAMFPVMPDRASVLGEFGGLGLPVEGHLWFADDKRNWGYRTFPDRNALQAAYEDLIVKLTPLVKDGLAAAIYTQTSDVETEVNGLMTYDRKVVKYDAAKLHALHHALTDMRYMR